MMMMMMLVLLLDGLACYVGSSWLTAGGGRGCVISGGVAAVDLGALLGLLLCHRHAPEELEQLARGARRLARCSPADVEAAHSAAERGSLGLGLDDEGLERLVVSSPLDTQQDLLSCPIEGSPLVSGAGRMAATNVL